MFEKALDNSHLGELRFASCGLCLQANDQFLCTNREKYKISPTLHFGKEKPSVTA